MKKKSHPQAMSDQASLAQQRQHASNLDTVTVIVLPQHSDKSPEIPSEGLSCSDCKWNGSLSELFRGTKFRQFVHPPETSDCSSCQLFDSIFRKLAGRKVVPKEYKASLFAQGAHYTYTIMEDSENVVGTPIEVATFTDMGTPEWVTQICGIYRRQWTENDVLHGYSARFARKCIDDCLESHDKCQSQRDSSFLPSRLINVAVSLPGGDPRLDEKSQVPTGSRYVALSYCWGGVKPDCTTTTATVRDRMRKISWHTLPATFRDAIELTRSLGVDYLWIDSVCIIQGDERDWKKESSSMFHVYKNSYATLAALDGLDSNQGLRDSSNKAMSELVAELRMGERRWPVYLHPLHYLTGKKWERWPAHEIIGDDDNYPLLVRAWTYQERMVSPRVLFFTKSEVIFQCSSNAECECGATRQDSEWAAEFESTQPSPSLRPLLKSHFIDIILDGLREDHDSEIKDQLVDKLSKTPKEVAANSYRLRVAQSWRMTIVSHYSALRLTGQRDKLAALGAIAEQFQTVRPDEKYLAGLWSGTLLRDLFWQTMNPEMVRRNTLPTWSWASVIGAIGYELLQGEKQDLVNSVDIVSATCEYAADGGFGVLDCSTLVLRGRILRCLSEWYLDQGGKLQCRLLYSKQGSWTAFAGGMVTTEKYSSIPEIRLDHCGTADEGGPAGDEAYVLQVMQSHEVRERWKTTEKRKLWGKENEKVPWTRAFLILRCREQNRGVRIYSRMGIWAWSGVSAEEMEARFDVVFDKQSVLEECELR